MNQIDGKALPPKAWFTQAARAVLMARDVKRVGLSEALDLFMERGRSAKQGETDAWFEAVRAKLSDEVEKITGEPIVPKGGWN